MKLRIMATCVLVVMLGSTAAYALSRVERGYIVRIVNGGASSVRDVASSVYSVQDVDPKVYDAIAEVLLRDYQKPNNQKTWVDAIAWMAKSLSVSSDSRYLSVLDEVRENAHNAKVRKHANRSYSTLKSRSSKSNKSYEKGMTNLAKYKDDGRLASRSNSTPSRSSSNGRMPISDIRVGMSSGEVFSLSGRPTSESQNITGKVFNPFNFGGRGIISTQAHYKGQGTVVFENSSAYTSGRRVIEVILDKYEPGYR